MDARAGTVGIVGFGRFGRSLGELMAESGIEVRAFDPHTPVPEPFAAASLAALVRASQVVVLAVPVPALEAVIAEASAILNGRHLVLDVASVKMKPVEIFDRHLADRVPWAATHPLFGPASLSRRERPLRVVVCPNNRHPARSTPPRASTPASGARSSCRTRSHTTGRWPARTRWGS